MLIRFLDALRGRPTGGPPEARPGAGGGAAAAARPGAPGGPASGSASGSAFAPLPPEPVLPHPSAMADAWRQQLARTTIALRERYPAGDDPHARAARGHAERLLVKVAVDLDMVVRQPAPAAQEALAVAGDPQCELPALVRVLERDPAVTRGLMRHASSVMFAASGPPASLDDAVRRLGAKGVQVAVLAGMTEALLNGGCGPYAPDAEAVWAHMVRVGPLARALARGFDVPTHEAFLVGLLHDVGKLVLFDLLGNLRHELRRDVELPEPLAADALRELHEPLGGLALLRWGVDPRAAWAVAHHHRRAPDAAGRRSELLYVAERLDLARVRRQPVDAAAVAAWVEEGRLTVGAERVQAAVERAP